MNKIYNALSQIPVIKNKYSLKFLFVAFIGIHIPLISIIIFFVSYPTTAVSKNLIIVLTLVFTLLATMLTLYILNCLLNPIIQTKNAINNYLSTRELPHLPTQYNDEVGVLMSSLQKTLLSLDGHIKEKQELSTLVSHNLRSPLNQILSLCNLIKIDKSETDEYVKKIELVTNNQLQNLKELLFQLMKSEINDNNEKVLGDINDIIKKELEQIDFDLKKKRLHVELNLSSDVLISKNNEKKLALVLHNLISNAVKFSYEGTKIIISTSVKDNKCEIAITDNGIGFSEDYKKNLFKDARSVGRKGTKNESSVGLGLHLCKKTITKLGGQLTAFSEGENKGATFKIKL